MQNDLVEQHMIICTQLNNIYEKKNKAYGNSFNEIYNELGLMSCITQLAHKWNRIKNLVKNPKTANYEGLEDSLKDLANYSVMTLMCLENTNKHNEY